MAEESQMDAQVRWVTGLQFVGQASVTNIALVLDGAAEFGGLDGGVRPMEALLISLASCTAMDTLSIMLKKKQRVTGFHVNAHAQRAEEHPRSFQHIELEFIVRGHDISAAAVERSIELSQTKYCAVTSSLKAQVVYGYRIEPEEEAR
ncbi:MAG: OsmC family protein [Anaerolineae bacterium]|nr:OsmC family protein [Anaerolineae bacterium]